MALWATILAFILATYYVMKPHDMFQFGAFPALLVAKASAGVHASLVALAALNRWTLRACIVLIGSGIALMALGLVTRVARLAVAP